VTLWLRARHVGWIAAVALVLSLVAGLATGRLPGLNVLYQNSEGAPLRLVLPALVATAVVTSMISPTPRAERAAARLPARSLLLAGVLAVVALATAECASVVVGPDATPGVFSRNLLGFVGIGLIGRAVLPTTLAPLLPLAVMIPTLTLGVPEGDLLSWPLLAEVQDPRGWLMAELLLVLGVLLERAREVRATRG